MLGWLSDWASGWDSGPWSFLQSPDKTEVRDKFTILSGVKIKNIAEPINVFRRADMYTPPNQSIDQDAGNGVLLTGFNAE